MSSINEEQQQQQQVRTKDYVILKRGSHLILHQLANKPRVRYLGADIDLGNVIGRPFSTVYRMELKSKNSYVLEACDPAEASTGFALECTEFGIDNRDIQDDNNAQSLSKDDIIGMRDSGLSSHHIVQQLMKNSKTFSLKTEYAQQKWMRKKSKKYTDYVRVLKPSIRLLSEVLLSRSGFSNTHKLLGLRVDVLSQMVTAVNFQPEGKYLVYENNCDGLVIATLLNLTGPKGKLLNITTPNYPFNKLRSLNAMKFSETKKESLVNVSIATLAEYSNGRRRVGLPDDDDITPASSMITNENAEYQLAVANTCDTIDAACPSTSEQSSSDCREVHLKRKAPNEETGSSEWKRNAYRENERQHVRNLLVEKADGLIVVCKEKANNFVKEMLQFLAPSRSFVVYCQVQEPLVELFIDLKQGKGIINCRLVENWLRSYQVLPDRTHPEITMSGTGGYLLTGIVVNNLVE